MPKGKPGSGRKPLVLKEGSSYENETGTQVRKISNIFANGDISFTVTKSPKIVRGRVYKVGDIGCVRDATFRLFAFKEV